MENNLIHMEKDIGEKSNLKCPPKNLDCLKEQNIENKIKNFNSKIKNSNKKYLLIIVSFIILLFVIILGKKNNLIKNYLFDKNLNKNKNRGVVELISQDKDKIKIKKELLKSINNFIACLGQSGEGKSTFGSNYYKTLYKVKNDYFESSDGFETFTKGIWMISDEERIKIPKCIYKDFLDVEGFQVDDSKSWKYVMIIAFLSTDLIILNNKPRYDEVKKMIKIIENSLKRMLKLNIPSILKVIYIQSIKKPENQEPIEELLESFGYDKNLFQMIKFKYIYLPYVSLEEGKEKDLMKYPNYKFNFEKILNILNNKTNYNSVASLMNFIDMFNDAINGGTTFDNQTIIKDIETDFNGVYSRYEKKKKSELLQKMNDLKLSNSNETFEDFINKQINLTFEFEINYEDFTFYGSSQYYNDYYENLKKNKTFRIEPNDIFYDFYITEKLRLKSQENKTKQEIYNIFEQKKREIDNYFALLKFYQKIEDLDLELKIDTELTDYKLEREKDLKNYFNEKIKEKKKDWEGQIERAKWKTPVQAYGEMKCENGHNFATDNVYCGECEQMLYWVDSDERYVICKGCHRITKIEDRLVCSKCGAKSKAHVKWIKGYKP